MDILYKVFYYHFYHHHYYYYYQGYFIDENKEKSLRDSIPYYTTQRQLHTIIKKAYTSSSLVSEAQTEFIENISNQIHILTGVYPKIDVAMNKSESREEIIIWEN